MLQYLTCRCAHVCNCATCSSQESAKAKTQKEVIKTLKELKLHLPAEKRHNNKSTTLNSLKYALRCVKQVEGKELSHTSVCPLSSSVLCYCQPLHSASLCFGHSVDVDFFLFCLSCLYFHYSLHIHEQIHECSYYFYHNNVFSLEFRKHSS